MKAFLEDQPKYAPGKCVISGSGDGPLINTGADFRDFHKGRIYVSVKSLAQFFRELGWASPDEVEILRSQLEEADEANEMAVDRLAKFARLEAIIEEFSEVREVEVIQKVKVPRKPTDDEIRAWVDANPTHPLVDPLRVPEPGSTEDWQRMYGKRGPRSKKQQERDAHLETLNRKRIRAQANVTDSLQSEGMLNDSAAVKSADTEGAPPSVVQLHEQSVDLDELLGNNVGNVKKFIKDQPVEFQKAVLRREAWLRASDGEEPRKGIYDEVNRALSLLAEEGAEA